MSIKRRQFSRTALACSVALIAMAPQVAIAQARATVQVAAQPLEQSLKDVARQTGTNILFTSEAVRGVAARPVQGQMSAEQAVKQLLTGTSLEVAADGNGGLLVRKISKGGRQNSAGEEVAGNAAANSDEGDGIAYGNEIVVTAQKREQKLIDVPIAISVVTGKDLDQTRTKGLKDLSLSVPGLAFAQLQPGAQIIVIRGVASNKGTSTLTGVYLDEIPMTVSAGPEANPDLSTQDLRRVEVLKGPQGTLFGEGSMGGTIRYITNDPALDRVEGSLEGTYFATYKGSSSYELNSVVNLPVVDDVLGLRVVTSYNRLGGWIDKVATPGGAVIKKDFNVSETKSIRIKGLWKPSEKLTVSAMVISQDLDNGGPNTVNVDSLSQSHYQGGYDSTREDSIKGRYRVYNITGTYDLGFAQLLSSTSRFNIYSNTDRSQVFLGKPANAAFVGLPIGGPVLTEIRFDDWFTDSSAWAQELRLTSMGDGPFQWTMGGYYKDLKSASSAGKLDTRVGGLDWFSVPIAPATVSSIRTLAAFADASLDLTDQLEVGGGLRYAKEKRFSILETTAPGTPHDTLRYSKLTYRAFVNYKLAERFSVYANTGTGFRAGGLNDPVQVALGAPPTYAPETITSYEVGAKGDFLDGRLSTSLALFQSDWKGIQSVFQDVFPNLATPDPNDAVIIFYTANKGQARIKGIELQVDWKPSRNWRLGFNGDITHGRFTKTSAFDTAILTGDWVDYTPEYSFSLYTEYDFAWSSEVNSTLRVDYNRQGKSKEIYRGNLSILDIGIAPPTDFVNVRFDVKWNDWTLALFSENLFDEVKPIRAAVSGYNTQNRRRTIGATLLKRF